MFQLDSYLWSLAILLLAALSAWLVSLRIRNVGIADSLWPLLFLAATLTFHASLPDTGTRATLVLSLVSLWALRLCAHITLRNQGEPEDRRYRDMRRRNDPGFAYKSLYLVFGLQALLAWVISLPLLAASAVVSPLGLFDALGVVLWLTGMILETGGDYQLARFKANPANRGAVMDRGFWRYTRHPNYFGDCCLWWGLYLIALGAGGWWSLISPLLMTLLLLRVSGVSLLEKDIGERRPSYRAYVARTNAFFPGPPKQPE